MNSKINKLFLLVFIVCYACSTSSDYFIDKWQITHVVENNTYTALSENWMHLKNDHTFESYDGDIKKVETGTWEYYPHKKRLHIYGEGDEGDSQWRLSVKKDTLFFHSLTEDLFLIATQIN